MSMIGNYLRLPEKELQRILRHPDSIMDFLYPEDGAAEPPFPTLDVDKAWHLIHFLLTDDTWGGPEPLIWAVLGGKEIGDVDVGYGPARYLDPAQVEVIAETLADISSNELWSRFDRQRVNDAEIYPQGWKGTAEERDYILPYFDSLKSFLADAARQREAVICYIN